MSVELSISVALLVIGLALLAAGAEALVRGASRLASVAGISPLVVGLTVVAYGTSMPEAMVSVQAALAGQTAITLGNVVGSNIFNVLFVLGISALVVPLVVARQLVRLDVPILIGVSIFVLILALDAEIGRLDGLLLFGGSVAYTVFAIGESRRESATVALAHGPECGRDDSQTAAIRLWAGNIALVGAGLGLLALGGCWLIAGAVEIAAALGVSDLVIGLTIVAAGTSVPEAATSFVAIRRGERDIAVGNLIGSSIFNLLFVLGLSAVIAPAGLPVPPVVMYFDLPVMLAVAVACLPIFFTGHYVERWEGALFLGYYGIYTGYLVLDATGHDALTAFSAVLLKFVVPLTLATLLVLFVHAARGRPTSA